MEYGLEIGIVVGLLVVGFLLKQIKLFIILAILAGGGAWVYLLDDEQKAQITEAIEESDQVKELKEKAVEQYESVAEDIKETVGDELKSVTKDAKEKIAEALEGKE